MTQPYPFTHTADTGHAKASAAKRLCSNRLRGNTFLKSCQPTDPDEASKPDLPRQVLVRVGTKEHRMEKGEWNGTATIAGMVYPRLFDRLRQGTCKTRAGSGLVCGRDGAWCEGAGSRGRPRAQPAKK